MCLYNVDFFFLFFLAVVIFVFQYEDGPLNKPVHMFGGAYIFLLEINPVQIHICLHYFRNLPKTLHGLFFLPILTF